MARILVGVSGGIAAYKAVELVRLATAAGHSVRVVQTPTSLKFVGAATFGGVTGAPVLVDEFEADPARGAFPGEAPPDHEPISHLELVRRCEAFAVVPASANTIAKLANGLADNLLTSAALACSAPLVIAPAMNDRMWAHPATQANVETLRLRGAAIVPPGAGRLASRGEWGEGRLAEPPDVLGAIERALAGGADAGEHPAELARATLRGVRVLVTAGGTREPIDSVRYVGNRSSGKMGLELAAEALRRGAEVTLVAANVSLQAPAEARTIAVQTAAELEAATAAEFPGSDILLMAAAVADFRPARSAPDKLKKAGRDSLELRLEPTVDVLGSLSEMRHPGQTLIGFAAEHGEGGLDEARAKLERKGLDAVVLNDISRSDIGFDSDDNEVTVVTPARERAIAAAPKRVIAAAILDEVESLRAQTRPAGR